MGIKSNMMTLNCFLKRVWRLAAVLLLIALGGTTRGAEVRADTNVMASVTDGISTTAVSESDGVRADTSTWGTATSVSTVEAEAAEASTRDTATYRVAFYNVENLFYPTRDSSIDDEDFTPWGSRHWTFAKFEAKCHGIFKVVAALDAESPLLCMGLAEVENAQVLSQLCYGTPLRYDHYRFVHFNSPDRRGVDVALLYRSDRMEVLQAHPIAVGREEGAPPMLTRDILSVMGRVKVTGDTLFLFVVHFPSKLGGDLETDERRRRAGKTLRGAMDSVRAAHPSAYIAAMGDFNATPHEAALQAGMGYAPYTNLMADFPREVGSHKYREAWHLIDHVVVSPALRERCRVQASPYGNRAATGKAKRRRTEQISRWRMAATDKGKRGRTEQISRRRMAATGKKKNATPPPGANPLMAAIFYRDFLLKDDDTYFGKKPFRTFIGPRYEGGYSDHLPVFIDIDLPTKPSP